MDRAVAGSVVGEDSVDGCMRLELEEEGYSSPKGPSSTQTTCDDREMRHTARCWRRRDIDMETGSKGRKNSEAMDGGGRHWGGQRWTRRRRCACRAELVAPMASPSPNGPWKTRSTASSWVGDFKIEARVSEPEAGTD